MSGTKTKRTAWDDRADMLAGLRGLGEFIETVEVPSDLAPAIATGRPELLALARPRALTEDECAKVYKLLSVLIRTNWALQEHARELEKMTADMYGHLKGALGQALKMEQFAGFRVADEDDDDE